MTNTANCQNCIFWFGQVDSWSGYADCRRYPPTNEKHPRGGQTAIWPATSAYHWCGEHKERLTRELDNGTD